MLTELQTLLELPETKLTPTTNLFGEDVGGDSLFVLNLVVALSQRWGLPITMEDIYDSPTPNTLLERLTTLTQEDV